MRCFSNWISAAIPNNTYAEYRVDRRGDRNSLSCPASYYISQPSCYRCVLLESYLFVIFEWSFFYFKHFIYLWEQYFTLGLRFLYFSSMQWLYPKLLHIHIQNVQKRVHILNIPSLLIMQDFILYKFRQNLQVRGNRRTLLRALKLYIGAWVWKESHKKYRNWRWNFNKPEKFWRG